MRRLLKKGRFVLTRKGSFVIELSRRILNSIKPCCRKIQIAGSIRRKEKNPVDIDIVLIPKSKKDKEKIERVLREKGKFLQGGGKRASFKIQGVKVELYYTAEDSWGATLLAYSSRFGSSIGLRVVAKMKGFKLNQYGLYRRSTGRKIAGRTEREIYHALGRRYKEPWDR